MRLPGDKIDRHGGRETDPKRERGDTYDCLLAARRVVGMAICQGGDEAEREEECDQQASVFSVDADARGAVRWLTIAAEGQPGIEV